MNRILITGGAGFIGSHLLNRLSFYGFEVTVLDNLNEQVHGQSSAFNIQEALKEKCQFVHGDIRDKELLYTLLEKNDVIVHLAAETGTAQSMYEVSRYVDVNCQGTALICDFLVNERHNIKKVVFSSSRAVYGEGAYSCAEHGVFNQGARTEGNLCKGVFEHVCPICSMHMEPIASSETMKVNPISVYGLTKYFQENLLHNVCESLNISYTGLRFQNVYGPGQSLINPYTGIISIFANLLRQDKTINIFEDGKESRDFVYVDDVIDAIQMAIVSEKNRCEIYNVGSGKQTTVLEIAETLKALLKSESTLHITGNYRKGDIRHNFSNIDKIVRELGFKPKTELSAGLSQFLEWAKWFDVVESKYDKSLNELKDKGLLK
jgi:dTDP-L-rhamnose 4-epimerase